MNKAWRVIVSLCVCLCVLPGVVSAQFGGGGGFGGQESPPPAPKIVVEFERTATQNLAPIFVLDPAAKASLTKVLATLETTLPTQEVQEVSLSEVVKKLQKESGVRITIDERGLADASIGTDTLITLPAEELTLRTVLDTVCSDHGLGWLPGRGGLIITTQEVRDTTMMVVIYPVADLVSSPDGDDYEAPIDVITATISPDSWRDSGSGEGTIAPYPAMGALVVAQPWHIHEQIQPLLQGLRESKTQQGIRGARKLRVEPSTTSATPQPMTGGGFF